MGNFISTAEKIRLPDDCTIGYIIEVLLEVTLTHTHLFHSHLENLQKLPTDTVLQQVSVSFQTTNWYSYVWYAKQLSALVEDGAKITKQ